MSTPAHAKKEREKKKEGVDVEELNSNPIGILSLFYSIYFYLQLFVLLSSLGDSRFSALFSKSDFEIDETSAEFQLRFPNGRPKKRLERK